MENLSVDNLLGIKYLNSNDLNLIFKTADNFKEVESIQKIGSINIAESTIIKK